MHEFDREYANGKDGRGYTFGVLEAHPADGGVNAYQSPQEEMTLMMVQLLLYIQRLCSINSCRQAEASDDEHFLR